MKPKIIILSCEHAVNTIPDTYRALFAKDKDELYTHWGFDIGAQTISQYLQHALSCELIEATTSRLLIDCNRSLTNHRCFSKVTKHLPKEDKQHIINTYYTPFRNAVTERVHHYIQQGYVVWHFSIHTFTPVLKGITRNAEIGLLYDPKRADELILAKKLKQSLKQRAPQYRVRMNYPYTGFSDCLTRSLRRHYPSNIYLGLELESNQILVENSQSLDKLNNNLANSLLDCV
jgi:predicted N-formylglutamate amidohydrolase